MAKAARHVRISRQQQNAVTVSISAIRINTASEPARVMRRKTGLTLPAELSVARITQNKIDNEEVIYG
jgi:hypothetical protein